MKMSHRVRICVGQKNGECMNLLKSCKFYIPKKFLTFLLGEFAEILILNPGKTVHSVEICEINDS